MQRRKNSIRIDAAHAADLHKSKDRSYAERADHQERLDTVRINDALKTTVYGIGDDDKHCDDHTRRGADTEQDVKYLSSSEKLGADVKEEEKHDDHAADGPYT